MPFPPYDSRASAKDRVGVGRPALFGWDLWSEAAVAMMLKDGMPRIELTKRFLWQALMLD